MSARFLFLSIHMVFLQIHPYLPEDFVRVLILRIYVRPLHIFVSLFYAVSYYVSFNAVLFTFMLCSCILYGGTSCSSIHRLKTIVNVPVPPYGNLISSVQSLMCHCICFVLKLILPVSPIGLLSPRSFDLFCVSPLTRLFDSVNLSLSHLAFD